MEFVKLYQTNATRYEDESTYSYESTNSEVTRLRHLLKQQRIQSEDFYEAFTGMIESIYIFLNLSLIPCLILMVSLDTKNTSLAISHTIAL